MISYTEKDQSALSPKLLAHIFARNIEPCKTQKNAMVLAVPITGQL